MSTEIQIDKIVKHAFVYSNIVINHDEITITDYKSLFSSDVTYFEYRGNSYRYIENVIMGNEIR